MKDTLHKNRVSLMLERYQVYRGQDTDVEDLFFFDQAYTCFFVCFFVIFVRLCVYSVLGPILQL